MIMKTIINMEIDARMIFEFFFSSGSGSAFGWFRSGVNGSDDVKSFDLVNICEMEKIEISGKSSDLVKIRVCFSDAVKSNEYVKNSEMANSLEIENNFEFVNWMESEKSAEFVKCFDFENSWESVKMNRECKLIWLWK